MMVDEEAPRGLHSNGGTTSALPMRNTFQRTLVTIFTVLALLLLAGGTFTLGRSIIIYAYFGFSFPDSLFNFAYVVLAAWACTAVALAILHQYRYIIVLAALTYFAGNIIVGALFLIGTLVPPQLRTENQPIAPVHGLPAMLVVILLVLTNALALYGAWRFILRNL